MKPIKQRTRTVAISLRLAAFLAMAAVAPAFGGSDCHHWYEGDCHAGTTCVIFDDDTGYVLGTVLVQYDCS